MNTEEKAHLTVPSGRLVWWVFFSCLAMELSLLLLDGLISYGRLIDLKPIRELFDMTFEKNVPTWFASTQALMVGIVLWLTALRVRLAGESRWKVIGWALLAALFTFIAMDDTATFHERIGSCMKTLRDKSSNSAIRSFLEKYPSYLWQLAVGPFFAAMGLFLIVFIWRQLQTTSLKVMIVLAFLFYGMAQGLDFWDGTKDPYSTMKEVTSLKVDTVRHFSRAIEEFMEMFGTTLFLTVFLKHFCQIAGTVQVRFEK